MSYEAIALLMVVSLMVTLITGQRIFGAVGAVAVLASLLLWGTGGSSLAFSSAMKIMKWYPLLTLPLFVFMGYILSETNMAEDLYKMIHVWSGGIRGGLAVGTIFLMIIISAINGLSVAGMAVGCTIALPEMLKRGYDKRMVSGVIQAGSSLGILVPPSVVLVLYALIARQPVGQLWLAGLIPGLIMGGMFIIYILVRCKIQPHLAPELDVSERNIPLKEKIFLLRSGLMPLVIFISMVGLFLVGATSLVESAAVGSLSTLLVAIVKKRLTSRALEASLRQTLEVSCMFMWIILAALCYGAVFDGLGAVKSIENFFLGDLNLDPWVILLLMQVSFLLMGTFLDDTAMLVIVAPLYIPLVGKLGFDLVWYGVLYTVTSQIAYITPPFGYNLFLMRSMAPDQISIFDIYRSIIPFALIMVIALTIFILFPELVLWLPEMVKTASLD